MPEFRSGSLDADLNSRQNADGGWAYRSGESWTEPTCWAVLSLAGTPQYLGALARARGWLANTQRADGGWAPSSSVDQSTWVTSMAVLALAGCESHGPARLAGLRWIITQSGADTGLVERLRRRLSGASLASEAPQAWPWFPETSSWAAPTAMSILALDGCTLPGAKERIELGARFLLTRRCRDGGWNHGGTPVRSETAPSYPETTGLGLVALRNRKGSEIAQAVARAETLLLNPGSAEGLAWLRLGLRAHGRMLGRAASDLRCWTVSDAALTLLARADKPGIL